MISLREKQEQLARERAGAEGGPEGVYRVPPDSAPVGDWKHVALDQLDRLLREIAAIGPKHTEAESIHRALTAYGMTDLPALPWKSAASGKPRGPYKKPEPVTCRDCRLMRPPAAMSKQPEGGYVCRVGGCATRVSLKQGEAE